MALSATRVSKAKPSDKLTDGGGLYLLVNPKGGRCCRLDYHYMGKRKTLASKCFAGSSRMYSLGSVAGQLLR